MDDHRDDGGPRRLVSRAIDPPTSTSSPKKPGRLFDAGSRIAPVTNIAKMGNFLGVGPGKDLGPAAGPFAVGFGAYHTVAGVDKMANGATMNEQVESGKQTAGGSRASSRE